MTRMDTPQQLVTPFVPEPDDPARLRVLFERALGAPASSSSTHTVFRSGATQVVLWTFWNPTVQFAVLRSSDASDNDAALAALRPLVPEVPVDHLEAMAQRMDPRSDVGWVSLWAAAEMATPDKPELSRTVWEALGSDDFVSRLDGCLAAAILGDHASLLGIECAALVEFGPIRAGFEALLHRTDRRAPVREKRLLLDPEVPLEVAVDHLRPLMTWQGNEPQMRVRPAEHFAVVEWDVGSPLGYRYLLESAAPSFRLLGGLSLDVDAVPPEAGPVHFDEAIGRAEAGSLDWLRAAANIVEDEGVTRLEAAIGRALTGDPASQRAGALAGIESGRPELHGLLERAVERLEDRNLQNVVRVALDLPNGEQWPSAWHLAWWATPAAAEEDASPRLARLRA